MADFDKALPILARHEGPLEDDPRDPGGITSWGVTIGLLRELGEYGDLDGDGDIDADDIRSLVTPADAGPVWRRAIWDKYGYGRISDQAVATKLIDMAAPLGAPMAHKLMQRALGRLGYPLVDDGRLGPKSWRALIDALERGLAGQLLDAFRVEAKLTFTRILAKHPEMEYARKGWMRRAGE